MNFYKHHIGDFAQATAHLTFVEDAAYSRLLRKYYAEEKPIPSDLKAAQRLVGARTREEREAVQTVLGEFFILADDGWRNKRADEELAKWAAQAETNRRIAEEREARKRLRDADGTTTNRSRNENDSCNVSFNESSASREPNQKPEARSQKPEERSQAESPTGDLSSESGNDPDAGSATEDSDDPPGVPPCPVKRIVELYHRELPMLAPIRELPTQAERMLRARWRSDPARQTLDWWREFFAYVRTCPFLVGEKTEFQADLLWLVRPTNFAKVINGNYEARNA